MRGVGSVALSSDVHDFCTLQIRPDTARVVNPNLRPHKTKADKLKILNIPKFCLLSGKNHKQVSACNGRSQRSFVNLFDVCGALSLLTFADISCHVSLSCVEAEGIEFGRKIKNHSESCQKALAQNLYKPRFIISGYFFQP